MQRIYVLIAVLLLGCGTFAAAACISRSAEPEPFSIVYNYDTSGYLETCGCSTHQSPRMACA